MRAGLKIIVMMFLCLPLLPSTTTAAEQTGNESSLNDRELTESLRRIFREHPELVMDVLREHSVDVLEIAQKGSQERVYRSMRVQWQEDLKNPKLTSYDRPVLGNPKAPVTIVAFSDYTCPHCANAAETILEVLAERKDKVRFIFKNNPRAKDPLAQTAAQYVTAAFVLNPEKAWAYHNAIFAGQVRLMKEGESFLRAEALAQGFNLQKMGAEVKGAKVRKIIDEDIAEAQKLKIPGTPYHLVNGLSIRGGMPLAAFLEAVDLALSVAKEK